MVYLFFKILLCLVLAAIVGGIIGWLLRGLGFKARLVALETDRRERLDRASGERDRLSADLAMLQDEHAGCGRRVEELGREVERLTAAHTSCGDEIASLTGRLQAAEKDLEARASDSEEAAALEAKLTALRREHAGCEETISRLKGRVRELENAPPMPPQESPGGRPRWLLAEPQGEQDDLQQIRGIGPVLERTLNRLGVFHFRQIARFSDDDIAWVAENVQAFPDRIVRDNWVGQAKALHLKKYDESV